jgi:arylsulfatase A-like enzyme
VSDINRRDFLKLAGLLSAGLAIPGFFFRPKVLASESNGQNVLIVVFDAMSASNLPLYGYPRDTMPNLTRLADRATVYHSHYANGPFTTPGTASLLTSTLPWTHRALNHNDTISEKFVDKTIFHAFSGHHTMAYTHNPLANTLLKQFLSGIDNFTPQENLFLSGDRLLQKLFKNDQDIATVAWTQAIKHKEENYTYSLFLPRLYEALKKNNFKQYLDEFPRGIPNIYEDVFFILEHGIDWLENLMVSSPRPLMGYFHFLPPHFPYNTRKEFVDTFADDGYKPPEKPEHRFALERVKGKVDMLRTWYDEYLLYVDEEFQRFFDFMEKSGFLENTWLVFTSDHGELFERGIVGHQTPGLYQAGVRVPLLIFEPGKQTRQDIYENTSAIDLMPTLLHLTEQKIPDWVQGSVLPPYSNQARDTEQGIVCLRGKGAKKDQPIRKGDFLLVRDNLKLIYIFGYENEIEGGEMIELYDVREDPEELNNRYPAHRDIGDDMLNELRSRLAEAERALD